ncbi:hypothetical protein BJ508DRAFT_333519 [Ascobolus immersus RN42]|uniref:Ecp2 effector protein domain-containing protein n=1 Tax=Ascobolus immersus RN42 TaxID=1160509 RepID=A0A3N4HPN6_ASCIM|nr:hypothetical protein BJ508DRAFT_333519 [Ascobolus immersus RN42]
MKLSLLSLFLASLATTVSANSDGFLIPSELPSGVYTARHTPSGDQFSLLSALPASRITKRQGASELPPGYVSICQDTSLDDYYTIGMNQAMIAARDSWNGAGKWADNNESVFVVGGTVVMYMCCYDSNSRCPAWYNELFAALVAMNVKGCDVGKAAYVTVPAWKKHYGRTRKGGRICAKGIQT